MRLRSVGVEEELLLVEPGTGQPRAVAGSVLHQADRPAGDNAGDADGEDGEDGGNGGDGAEQTLEGELQQQQMETSTRPCHALDDLGREIQRCRAAAADAARRAGVQIAALATSPAPVQPTVADKPRYQRMTETFGLTASEQLTCGMHVHVAVASPDEGAAVLDRIQPWLPVLLALSANSPFWQGRDSAYASFRYQAWGRWPSSGPPGQFGTAREYHRVVRQMIATGTLLDTGMVYFDARLSEHYPTIELRVSDVCLRAGDAVLIAALCRALVETEARAWREGEPVRPVRTELLRLASWRASRSGLDDALVHPLTWRPAPAAAVTRLLAGHVADALADAHETATVAGLLGAVLDRGNGATVQREAYRRSGRLAGVVDRAATVTMSPP